MIGQVPKTFVKDRSIANFKSVSCEIKTIMPVRPLSPELAEKARVELNEDPQRLEDGLIHLKEWLSKQPHIKAKTDDQSLVVFLRGCKYSLERAKQKLDLFYTLRTTEPSIFNSMPTLEFFKEVMDLGPIVIIPNAAGPAEPLVTIYRMGVYDPAKLDLIDLTKCSNIIQKILFYENDNAVVAGIRGIMDLENSTMAHFLQMNPTIARKMTLFMQDAAPVRMKSNHYINTIPGFETVFNLFKSFLNEKNKNRLFVHGKNYEELYEFVPRKILPAEYGGEAGPLKNITDYWKKKAEEYWSWLEEDLQYCTDESKRPGKPKTADELFGIEGSFRQLQVD